MKKLITMTDFVLEQDFTISVQSLTNQWASRYNKIMSYAKFIKQPLELWMFVPCDENGYVLKFDYPQNKAFDDVAQIEFEKQYQQAKEICIFNNNLLSLIEIKELITQGKTIEFLINYHYEKTGSYLETKEKMSNSKKGKEAHNKEKRQKEQIHGTLYSYGNYKCRCELCKKANTDYCRGKSLTQTAINQIGL
jgi:hypothetical protein